MTQYIKDNMQAIQAAITNQDNLFDTLFVLKTDFVTSEHDKDHIHTTLSFCMLGVSRMPFDVSMDLLTLMLKHSCHICDQRITPTIDDNVITYTHTTPCFVQARYNYTITPTSDTLVIMNDVRQYTKPPANHFLSLNTLAQQHQSTLNWQQHNVLTGFVGNTYVHVFNYGNYLQLIPAHLAEPYGDCNLLGIICCDLWWIMAIDKTLLNIEQMDKDDVSYIEIKVTANKPITLSSILSHDEPNDIHTLTI